MKKIHEIIKNQIYNNPILLYMKGSPECPNCGFSSRASKILSTCNNFFAYIDILQHTEIRTELPRIANWPTFPQLWIDSELIGGCDIIIDMYKNNELQKLIQRTMLKYNMKSPNVLTTINAYVI